MITTSAPVLVSWIAANNDPYERHPKTREALLEKGEQIPGPTLTLLFDADSPFAGKVRDVVLLCRTGDGQEQSRDQHAFEETRQVLRERDAGIQVHAERWDGTDPTDHRGIFDFLRARLPEIRRCFVGRNLVLHISPGTPSMQTIWVLMAETGYVEAPFQVVKSYRREERRGRPAVVPVEVGIDTFYKVYRTSHPSQVAGEEESVLLDPAKARSDELRRVFAEARRFAQVNIPVLLLGERGTGKSTLATWIRLHSPFRKKDLDGHWPSVACGQYNPETMRSELFGHKRGSFTGAISDKPGLLSTADKDTLFLDEIGDVSRDVQRLLIKAIEEKRFLRLGDDLESRSDFRLISATNLGYEELDRRLDPDFRDRVSTLMIRLPPLREIRDDLDWIWESVFQVASRRAGVSRREGQLGVAQHRRLVARLREHPLPSNLRDLFRVAYRIIAARADVHTPLSEAEAVDYGLVALQDHGGAGPEPTSRAVARAFANAAPIDNIVSRAGKLSTRELERDLQVFIAEELRRIARASGRPIEELCDKTERTLRQWARGEDDGKQLPHDGEIDPKSTQSPRKRPGRR